MSSALFILPTGTISYHESKIDVYKIAQSFYQLRIPGKDFTIENFYSFLNFLNQDENKNISKPALIDFIQNEKSRARIIIYYSENNNMIFQVMRDECPDFLKEAIGTFAEELPLNVVYKQIGLPIKPFIAWVNDEVEVESETLSNTGAFVSIDLSTNKINGVIIFRILKEPAFLSSTLFYDLEDIAVLTNKKRGGVGSFLFLASEALRNILDIKRENVKTSRVDGPLDAFLQAGFIPKFSLNELNYKPVTNGFINKINEISVNDRGYILTNTPVGLMYIDKNMAFLKQNKVTYTPEDGFFLYKNKTYNVKLTNKEGFEGLAKSRPEIKVTCSTKSGKIEEEVIKEALNTLFQLNYKLVDNKIRINYF